MLMYNYIYMYDDNTSIYIYICMMTIYIYIHIHTTLVHCIFPNPSETQGLDTMGFPIGS